MDPEGTVQTYEAAAGAGSFHYRMDINAAGTMVVHGATTVAPGEVDAHVQTFSSTGVLDLDIMLSGSVAGVDHGRGAAWHPDGDVIVCGGMKQNWHTDMYVSKIGVDGTVRWTTWIAGTQPSNDTCYGVAANDAGDIFATGAIRNNLNNGMWTARLSASGAVLWEDVQDSALHETGFFVAPGSDGSVTVAGYRDTPLEGQNALVVRYDAAGTVKWNHEYNVTGVDGKDYSSDLFLDASDNVYLVGQHQASAGVNSSYLQKRRGSDGSVVWTADLTSLAGKVDVRSGFLACGDVYVAGTVMTGGGYHELFYRQLSTDSGATLSDDTRDILSGQQSMFVTRRNPVVSCPDTMYAAGWTIGPAGQEGFQAVVDVTLENNEPRDIPAGALPVESLQYFVDNIEALIADPTTPPDAIDSLNKALDLLNSAIEEVIKGHQEHLLDDIEDVWDELEDATDDGLDVSVLMDEVTLFGIDLLRELLNRAKLIMDHTDPVILQAEMDLATAVSWYDAGDEEEALNFAEDGSEALEDDLEFQAGGCAGGEEGYAADVCLIVGAHDAVSALSGGDDRSKALNRLEQAAEEMVLLDQRKAMQRLGEAIDHLYDLQGGESAETALIAAAASEITRRHIDDAIVAWGDTDPDVVDAEVDYAAGETLRLGSPPDAGEAVDCYRKASEHIKP